MLRSQKMQSYRIHTDSETKTVANKPGCKDTMVMHMGPSPDVLQGPDLNQLCTRRIADKNRQKKKP